MVSSEWSIEVFLFLQTTWIKYSAVQDSFASHPCESTTAAEKGCLCHRYHVMMEKNCTIKVETTTKACIVNHPKSIKY